MILLDKRPDRVSNNSLSIPVIESTRSLEDFCRYSEMYEERTDMYLT
jgi:hypothetical protein